MLSLADVFGVEELARWLETLHTLYSTGNSMARRRSTGSRLMLTRTLPIAP